MRGLCLGLLLLAMPLHAEVWDSLCIDRYDIDTAQVGQIRAEVNALAFFQNNEFSSRMQKGYTLPGAWMNPKITYTPLPQVYIEAGAHLMFYDGANRYPNYAYQDIARWKGNQHTHGVHALPWFRAQATFHRGGHTDRSLNVILGNIYGCQNHQLIRPMFNAEQNLSSDPEMGFQLLLDRRHVHLDMWMNWQSYIFNLDSHQEAFTVGINSTLKWSRPERKIQWETPVQILVQHRGGELDTTALGVQTLCNGSVGARMTYRPSASRKFQHIRAEANVLGSWQQSGSLWPFDLGVAFHAGAAIALLQGLQVEAGYVGIPHQFANLFGSPFFGTISTKFPGTVVRGLHTAYASASYFYTFDKLASRKYRSPQYQLGAQFDLYSVNPSGYSNSIPFGFGLYMRVRPSFLLNKRGARQKHSL